MDTDIERCETRRISYIICVLIKDHFYQKAVRLAYMLHCAVVHVWLYIVLSCIHVHIPVLLGEYITCIHLPQSDFFFFSFYVVLLDMYMYSSIAKLYKKGTKLMKGTEVPNPRRSSACDCSCVLTRIDHCLVNNSIMTIVLELIWHAFRYQFIPNGLSSNLF